MFESFSGNLQDMPGVFWEKIENTANNVVKSIKEVFEKPRVTDGDVNAYINTYFSLWYILNVGQEYLFQCLNDKMESAWLYLKKPKNFDESGEKSVLNGWEVCISWKYLREFFEWYFSLIEKMKWIDNIEDLRNMKENFDVCNSELSKILRISNSPFMEKTAWRKSGEWEEYCGAHLRNLLSPFKNLIGILNNCPEWDSVFKFIKDKLIPSCEENERMINDFCEFLDEKIEK